MSVLLVVDDEPLVREVLTRGLERAGHTVSVAANGKEAQAHLCHQRVDLVIADLFMPEMDGLELIMWVRETLPGMPIIALSGGCLRHGVNKADMLPVAGMLGAVRVLDKTVGLDEIARAVSEGLN